MVGKDFYFNGKRLSDFGFVMVAADSDDVSGLDREILKGSMNQHRAEANHYGAKYTEPIQLNFKVINSICKGNDDDEISYPQLRSFQAWLTSTSVPTPLILDFEEGPSTEYLGIFNEIQPVVQRGLNGIKFKFTCNSPFAYETQGFTMFKTDSNRDKFFLCNSDEMNFVYPQIELTNIDDGEFSIVSETDKEQEMKLTLDSSYEKYLIDCKYKRIIADDSEVLTLEDVGWSIESITDINNVNTGIYKAYWLRILPGYNKVTVSDTADCNITFKSPIKIGGYVDV